jgi:ATP-dependent Lhr-like helicase
MTAHSVHPQIERWFAQRGWQPFEFQREVWQAAAQGQSGLLHATTGSGKTYAVWLAALNRWLLSHPQPGKVAVPLRVLWITPMRALAADTHRAISEPVAQLQLPWTLGLRSGDTASAERARQDRRMPSALVTTPESLSLLLSRANAREVLSGLDMVIVDEWHELLANKRGVQVQLALARLRQWNGALVVWGLSATLGDLSAAASALLHAVNADSGGAHPYRIVQGKLIKDLRVDTLLPPEVGRFTWGGHLGMQMLEPVAREIDEAGTTLVFTNTRSQAEIWYQQLLQARPEWAGQIALHHGSLDKEVRDWVEQGLKEGRLKAVVATSSLDLGVDFLPVERVLQVGSAKGVARLLQRAGRSGHAPGRPSRITLVPTHAMEVVEGAAARRAAMAGRIESREAPHKPLDVLVQHLVTIALGGGFKAEAMYDEVKRAFSYRTLTRDEWQWALAFIERGGDSLAAYPEYHRARPDAAGVWRVSEAAIAKRHRLNIGTIVSDASMSVKYLSGSKLGNIEESFIARLRRGDCFVFGGKLLEYVRSQEMTAFVKKAERNKGAVPRWAGGKMPLSTEMADAVLDMLKAADQGDFFEPEMLAARELLDTQRRLSALPTKHILLIEQWQSREGHHLYCYPFAGRYVHLGLGSLLAYRLAKDKPNTFSISVNDYGFELLSVEPVDMSAVRSGSVFTQEDLIDDVLASLNSGELAQRRFREIARVAGLVIQGYPGAARSTRQLQASSSLFYEVFKKYDSSNRLLAQAEAEVMAQELELQRLTDTLKCIKLKDIKYIQIRQPTPMSFPLLVERLREKLSTEKLSDRVARMLRDMDKQASVKP